MAHSDCGWTCGCSGKTVKSLENTRHTWALMRWWFTTKRRYIKCMHLYLQKLLRRSLWKFYRNVSLDTEVIIKFRKSSGSRLRSRYLLYSLSEFLPCRGRAVLRSAVCFTGHLFNSNNFAWSVSGLGGGLRSPTALVREWFYHVIIIIIIIIYFAQTNKLTVKIQLHEQVRQGWGLSCGRISRMSAHRCRRSFGLEKKCKNIK